MCLLVCVVVRLRVVVGFQRFFSFSLSERAADGNSRKGAVLLAKSIRCLDVIDLRSRKSFSPIFCHVVSRSFQLIRSSLQLHYDSHWPLLFQISSSGNVKVH
jgi:hypothetical protein